MQMALAGGRRQISLQRHRELSDTQCLLPSEEGGQKWIQAGGAGTPQLLLGRAELSFSHGLFPCWGQHRTHMQDNIHNNTDFQPVLECSYSSHVLPRTARGKLSTEAFI